MKFNSDNDNNYKNVDINTHDFSSKSISINDNNIKNTNIKYNNIKDTNIKYNNIKNTNIKDNNIKDTNIKYKIFKLANLDNNLNRFVLILFLTLTLFLSFSVVASLENQNNFNFLQENPIYKSSSSADGSNIIIPANNADHSKGVIKAHAASKVSTTSKAKLSSIGSSKTVSQKGVISSSKNLKKYVLKNKRLPSYVTVEGYRYSVPEFTYLMTKTIEYQKKNSNSRVTVNYNIKNPTKPSGTNIKANIYQSNYYKYSLKTTKYIDKYNKVPNYISRTKNSKIQYQTAVYMFASVLNYDYYKNKLPKYVTLKISSSNKINKYIPKYTRTSKTKSVPNTNSIWVQSKDFYNVNFDKLAESGIGNVFLHEATISQYGKSNVINWAKNAAKKGIKTHLWIQCFYANGKWINPIDTSKKTYNQAQFNKILSKIKTYSRMDYIGGIHLDYLRYPGTAYKYSYSNGVTGEKAITKFVSQAKSYVNKYNPNILLSAAVMPETSSDAYYYGQNIPKIGKYLDIITPMIYKGNYGMSNSWITSTTKWFVKNSGGARIWSGLQTYKSDNNPVSLSTGELYKDSSASIKGGADGLALFRWGLTKFFNFLSLY